MLTRLLVGFAVFLLALPIVAADEPLPTPGEPDPTRLPSPQAARPNPATLRHLMVAYAGAQNAPATVLRTKEEARTRAIQLAALARSKGFEMRDLATKYSDDAASAGRGGMMGVVPAGSLPADLDRAAFALGIGQVSDPVESGFGFHIFQRLEVIAASHILVMYKGSMRAPPEITRSKDEAKQRIEDLAAKLKAGGRFEDLAGANSDCPSRARGGNLGLFGRGMMAPEFEKAAFALAAGGISDIVETPFGFHIIRRDPTVRASHILVGYAGTGLDGVTRSKEEAKAKIEKLLAELKNGGDLAKLATANSDCPSKALGGDLGTFTPGQMVPEFDQAVFALKVGETSGIVETHYGFHIIQRTE